MKKHSLLFLALLLLSKALIASPTPLNAITTLNSEPPRVSDCQYAPPQDFHLIWVGANDAKYGWTPQANVKHHTITYRRSDNHVLNDTITPAGTTELAVPNLPENTECYAVIHAMCEDGSDGPGSGEISLHTVILEVLVIAFQEGGQGACTMSTSNQSCNFPMDGGTYNFKVTYGVSTRQFGVKYVSGAPGIFKVFLGSSGNNGYNIKIFCDSDTDPGTTGCTPNEQVTIKYLNTPIASFTIYEQANGQTSTGLFQPLSFFNSGATIQTLITPRDNQRDEQQVISVSNTHATSSPNPFSDVLNIKLQSPIQNNTNLSLFRPDGQLVSTGRIDAGQTDYTIDTATLPTGFYFLRVQSGDQVQVLKVVKSE